jgi:tetratricopeptide (TPR) repeat protein
MYAFKAAGSYSSKQYKTAAKMASKALKLNPGESSARLVQTQVNNKVNALMSEALAAKNQGNYGRAKKLFKQLLGILPSQDNRYAQASRMLRDIVADEDDDEDD